MRFAFSMRRGYTHISINEKGKRARNRCTLFMTRITTWISPVTYSRLATHTHLRVADGALSPSFRRVVSVET